MIKDSKQNYVKMSNMARIMNQANVPTNEPRMRKNIFCICENKGADQLHSNRLPRS